MTTDFKKWVQMSFLAGGALAWVFLREIFSLAVGPLGFERLDWIIAPADVAAIISGLAVFVVLLRWERAQIYMTEVFAELTKVTWPKRKETLASAGVVAVLVGIATLCILFFDSICGFVAKTFLYGVG